MARPEGERKTGGRRAPRRAPAVPPRGLDTPDAAADAGLLPELVRRGLALGVTGLFLTEEALRRALGEGAPRDWLESFVAQGERTRAELVERLSRDVGRVLSAVDPAELLRRLLEGRTLEIRAEIRLQPAPRASRGATRPDDAGAGGPDDE